MTKIINKIKEILPNIFIYLLLFLCVFWVLFLCRYNTLGYDDFIECSYRIKEGIFDSLLPGEEYNGGGYTCIFLTKLTTLGIPYLLNIHPQDYLFQIAPIIKGILFSIFFYVTIKCTFLRNKNKWLFFTSFTFFMLYLLYIAQWQNCMFIKDNITFFRYVFSTMFFTILFSYIYKTVIFRNSKLNFKEGILIFLAVIVTASNLETIIYVFYCFFFILIGYNFLIDFIYLFKKFKHSKSLYKYNLNIKFWIPVLFYSIVGLIYIYSPRYWNNFSWRGFGSFGFDIKDVLEFFDIFFYLYIYDNLLYWIGLFLIIFISLYKNKSILKKKKLMVPIFMLVSIVLVYLALIVCGKHSYNGSFWITDVKLIIFFEVMILSPFFILLDDLLRHSNLKLRKICITFVSSCFFIIALFYISLIYQNRHLLSDVYIFQKVNYINEKMYRYFVLKNETPYLIKINPNPRDGGWIPFPFLEILESIPDWENKQIVCSFEDTRTSIYLEKVYNVKLPDDVKFCLSDEALNKFFNIGGVITKSELNNINFSNLKNAEYVLNTEVSDDKKLSKEEIEKIFKTFYK